MSSRYLTCCLGNKDNSDASTSILRLSSDTALAGHVYQLSQQVGLGLRLVCRVQEQSFWRNLLQALIMQLLPCRHKNNNNNNNSSSSSSKHNKYIDDRSSTNNDPGQPGIVLGFSLL